MYYIVDSPYDFFCLSSLFLRIDTQAQKKVTLKKKSKKTNKKLNFIYASNRHIIV